MRYAILSIFILLFSKKGGAQHCPFDGAYIIALQVIDSKGKVVNNKNATFQLKEIAHALSDSCLYEKGLVEKKVLAKKEFIKLCNEKYGQNSYNKDLLTRLASLGVTKKSNYYFVLNQSQQTCTTIQPSTSPYTNYVYIERKFKIEYSYKGKKITKVLPKEALYSLCTGSSKLNNFEPFIIQL
jgi:hypothetical protein